jgi:hypothetical protein
MNTNTALEQIDGSLETYGNENGTESQLNKARELLGLAGAVPSDKESERLESLGDKEGTEAQLSAVTDLLHDAVIAFNEKALADFLELDEVKELFEEYPGEDL